MDQQTQARSTQQATNALTEEQTRELQQQLRGTDRNASLAATAVLLSNRGGWTAEAIADLVGGNVGTIDGALNAFRNGGLAGLRNYKGSWES